MLELNKIYCGDCKEVMANFPDDCIDLTVTSPPYDDMRLYKGFVFDFEGIAQQLYRVTKSGGVVVWVVADETKNGSETGTSFRQALYFMSLGFNLHDTMIWEKPSFTDTGSLKVRYPNVFEYMFVLSKGKIKTFNPIKDRLNISFGKKKHGTIRQKDGTTKRQSSIGKKYTQFGHRFNVWKINQEMSNTNRKHPGQFPEPLASDHIISWSNKGDLVLDPFSGAGTTSKMARENHRDFVGIEISEEYIPIIEQRIKNAEPNLF